MAAATPLAFRLTRCLSSGWCQLLSSIDTDHHIQWKNHPLTVPPNTGWLLCKIACNLQSNCVQATSSETVNLVFYIYSVYRQYPDAENRLSILVFVQIDYRKNITYATIKARQWALAKCVWCVCI